MLQRLAPRRQQQKNLARGLKFGTTGIHQPFGVLVDKGTIFGRKLVTYLDAGASTTPNYIAFLAATPANWQGVQDVIFKDGVITVSERGARTIEIRGGPAFDSAYSKAVRYNG